MKEITIGQRFEMGKQVAEKLDGMDGDAVQLAINSASHPFWSDMVKHFGQKVRSVFRALGKMVTVLATKAKNTADCFTDRTRYYYRDASNLDRYLPKVQPDQPESKFAVLELTQAATLKEMAEHLLGVQGDIKTLSKLLKGRGYTTALPAIEVLIERQENGEDTGLLTNGWINFFFVENKEEEGKDSVSVVFVGRDVGEWYVSQYSLGHAFGWGVGRHLFVRNFPGTL